MLPLLICLDDGVDISALPAGSYDDGCYDGFCDHTYFWSATEDGESYAYGRSLDYDCL